MMKYVLYHSSITSDKSAVEKLRAHAHNGEILAEYFDDLSSSDARTGQQEALTKCKETGATLLIFDLSTLSDANIPEEENIPVKRLN